MNSTEQTEQRNDPETDATKILRSVFGYKSFRPYQEEAIAAVLSGRDVFASMPTGGGKSLCYQIPGMLFNGLTVVISPLIALMKDQVDDAIARGIGAAFINSSLKSEETASVYSRLYRGEIKLLYVSPERLAVEGYLEKLKNLNVSFFAVDEAHCLSEWGHDFRPDYLFLSRLRDNFPQVPIAAFTATATGQVQEDIIRILKLSQPFTVRASFNRRELNYKVSRKSDVLSQIHSFLRDHPGEPGIIYRISRKDVEKTASYLVKKGIKALPYHAGLSKEERTRNQNLFNNDEVDVITATTAFGMGINKNNIRYVVHGDLPKSMEGYYQETGRAGRDGLDSFCVLFSGPGDIVKQRYFIDQIEDSVERERSISNLNQIARFATVHVCRRRQILEYFGEEHDGSCGNCDVCNDTAEKVEATVDAQKVLSAIVRTEEGFGINYIIDLLRGTATEKISSRQHNTLKTFGVGKDKSKKWWRGIINELIGQEQIYRDHDHYNVLRLTESGKKVLFGQEPFFISSETAVETPHRSGQLNFLSRNSAVDGELFLKLKQLRTELAQEKRVPPYIIFSDKTLSEMAAMRPVNQEEFLSVSGVGEKKLEEYGPRFLPLIAAHLEAAE